MTKPKLIAARVYLEIKNLNSLGKKRRMFFLVFMAVVVFSLMFVAKTTLAEGEYMTGFKTGAGDFLSGAQDLVQWVLCGAVTAYLTANVLQWVINNQTEMIQFNGEFIKNGLITTQSLADMLLILAFVIASFGIIFKVREFEAKKIVTTIVLTAIFTRFGTLIVKMMVDIGNITINTIVGTNTDLIVNSTLPLVKDALISAGVAIGGMTLYAGALSVPYLNIAAVIAGVAGLSSVGASFMGFDNPISSGITLTVVNFLVKWVLELIACYTLSGVYITFILLFLSRVFMISILAVISPLAIMAYALPQTRKFYNQWWSSLVRWTFLGVWTLFLLMLGMGSAGFIMPTTLNGISGTLSDGIFSQVIVDSGMLYYLFLIVYLALVQDMANKESGGVASLFKSAMIGAGAAVVTNAVKPVTNTMREHAMKDVSLIDQKYSGRKEQMTRGDKFLKYASGITAKGLEEKQLSNYASMFSGDHKRAAAATKDFSKSFDFSKLKKGDWEGFSNIDPMLDTMISAVGKDNTVQGIIKKGEKATVAEGIWSMQNAKTEDMPELIKSLGKNASSYLNYAIKGGRLTPSQIKSIARNTNAMELSSALRDEFLNKDKKDGNANLNRVKSFMGLGEDITREQQEVVDEMTALATSLRGSTRDYESFKKISGSVLENEKNLNAMLISGTSQIFGFADRLNPAGGEKLRQATLNNFNGLIKANPDMIDSIVKNVGGNGDMIPDSYKTQARAQVTAANPTFNADQINEAVNAAVKTRIEGLTQEARQEARAAAQAAAQGAQQTQ